MHKTFVRFFFLIVFLVVAPASGQTVYGQSPDSLKVLPEDEFAVIPALSASAILRQADMKRSPWSDFTMLADLVYQKRGERTTERFRVFVHEHTKSLVSYLEPDKQRGNMLLMVGDNLWYYVNKTSRPMRITPIQKLSGGASYGDITRLNWSGDYRSELVGQDSVDFSDAFWDCWVLQLQALSSSATYHSIVLSVEKNTFVPRKAVVYLRSGKKMKTLFFTQYQIIGGKMMNTRIDFIDHLSADSQSSMIFSKISLKTLPDRYFLKTSLPSLYGEVVY